MPGVPSPHHFGPDRAVLSGPHGSMAPTRLPMTPLLGRDDVLRQVLALLDANDVRLLTLTGPGGIGKTRIAVELVSRLTRDYADGTCFVSLAPVQEASQVIPAVAKALGIRETGDVAGADALASVLRDRHMLLALDNFEHVIEAAVPWLGDMLSECPRLTVLVTSRTALRVAGERRYPVPPLLVPELGSFDAHLENSAVRLFVERAAAVRHDFALNEANAEQVRAICLQLDGIPLAIELAAARVTVLSPEAIAARLTDRLALLSSGDRDQPLRHRTMRDTIQWSYDLLSEPQQQLFRRLAVFIGGFTLEAAEDIGCSTGSKVGDGEILDVVASLADHSLIQHGTIGRGEPRFWMLETIRQFGLECLSAHGEDMMARDAHAAWYLRMGAEAEPGLQGAEQVRWLDRLESEFGNVQSVFTWLLEQERFDDAANLMFDTMFFRFIRGHNREFQQYLEAFLKHPHLASPSVARGKALLASGVAFQALGIPEAPEELQEALSVFREFGERRCEAFTLPCLGIALMLQDDLAGAAALFEQGISLAREVNLARMVSVGLGNLGVIAWRQGRFDDALALQHEGLEAARDGDDVAIIAQSIGGLGEFAFYRGDYIQAESLFRENLELITALGDRRTLPFVLMSLAKIARVRREYEIAHAHLVHALSVAREIGDLFEGAYVSLELGWLASERGQHVDALQAIRQSITTLRKLGAESGVAGCLDAFTEVMMRTGDMTLAARIIGAADAAFERISIPRTEGLPQQQYEERISRVRSALGMAAFVAAYGGGREMRLEQAVADSLAFEPPEAIVNASTLDTSSGLSPRELEVLRLMADGLSNQEIAGALFVSPRTVASHASTILGKLGLTSRTGAVAYAIRNGLA